MLNYFMLAKNLNTKWHGELQSHYEKTHNFK